MATSSVKLQDVSKKYKIYSAPYHQLKEILSRRLLRSHGHIYHEEFCALQEINLEIFGGETFGIIGRNGSGKSTLLQIMAGILQPTTGTVLVQGRVSTLMELGAGFSLDFSGRENVFMSGIIHGMNRQTVQKRFKEIETFADIGSFMDRPVRTYSSGMYVRLAFATAINLDPDILIIDEVLAVGDEIFRRRCYQKLLELQKNGKTIIFVSHSLQAVKSLCSRAMLLDRGRAVVISDPNRVVHTYNSLISSSELLYARKHAGTPSPAGEVVEDDQFPTAESSVQGEGSTEYRYGSQDAEIIHFELLDKDQNRTSLVDFGSLCTVRIRAHFNRDVPMPEIGMRITTLTGISVSGTTTGIEGVSLAPAKAGDRITAEFDFHMKLKPESYTLSVGVSEALIGGEQIALDRRMDAMIFRVIGNKKPRGLVDLGFKVRLDHDPTAR